MPSKNKDNISSNKPDNKRKKTDTSDTSNSDLSNFSRLIDSIANDESLTEKTVDLLIGNDLFRNAISGKFNSVLDDLKCEISDLKKKEWTIWNNIHEEHVSKYLVYENQVISKPQISLLSRSLMNSFFQLQDDI